jgi:hypothetical protein
MGGNLRNIINIVSLKWIKIFIFLSEMRFKMLMWVLFTTLVGKMGGNLRNIVSLKWIKIFIFLSEMRFKMLNNFIYNAEFYYL